MKMPQTKEMVGSAKSMGLTLGGFIGANAVAKAVNKDNWKVNGLMTVISLLVLGATKKEWQKNLATGTGVYFGIKTMNNLTTEVVNGLSGVPDSVKEIMNKYIPRLGETDEDDAVGALNASEREILLGYMGNATGAEELLGNTPRAIPANISAGSKAVSNRNTFMCKAINGLNF
jgi:hypothetical protein